MREEEAVIGYISLFAMVKIINLIFLFLFFSFIYIYLQYVGNVVNSRKIREIPSIIYVSALSLLNQKSQGPIIYQRSDTIRIEILLTFDHIFN